MTNLLKRVTRIFLVALATYISYLVFFNIHWIDGVTIYALSSIFGMIWPLVSLGIFSAILFNIGRTASIFLIILSILKSILDSHLIEEYSKAEIFNSMRPILLVYFIPTLMLTVFTLIYYFFRVKRILKYIAIFLFMILINVYNHFNTEPFIEEFLKKIYSIPIQTSGGAIGLFGSSLLVSMLGLKISLILLLSTAMIFLIYITRKYLSAVKFRYVVRSTKENTKEYITEKEIETRHSQFEKKSYVKRSLSEDIRRFIGRRDKSESKPEIDREQKSSIPNSLKNVNSNKYTEPKNISNVLKSKDSASSSFISNRSSSETLQKIFKSDLTNGSLKEKLIKDVERASKALEDVLEQYGIEGRVINTEIGPSITRFELSIARGVRVKKVVALSDDIAMNLAAESVRIEAPIPGKNAIGVEIPNKIKSNVYFGSLIRQKDKRRDLDIVLGKDIVGDNIIVDLRSMPHLLVAGRTGAGKSVGINVIIASILYTASSKDVKFILIDPKMVELMPYNGIPHLYVPVITDPQLAANALDWAVQEMENRYQLLSNIGVRNLDSYNTRVDEKLPYIVIIIDELADLMMVAPSTIERSISRIAQKARAVGIHLIIATQRPSIDVITGTIKANLPSRISFAVTSQIDSRTILDSQGAEKLLGRGDMLFLDAAKPYLKRIQGAYISDSEISKFVSYLKSQGKPEYNNQILESRIAPSSRDELYDRAVEISLEEGKISTSFIQRKLRVGYSRAARIVDQMKEDGISISDENSN